MADLFEGAPPEWLQNFGEDAFHALDHGVMRWIYDRSTKSKPPEAASEAADYAYNLPEHMARGAGNVRDAISSMDVRNQPGYISPEQERAIRDEEIRSSTHARPDYVQQPMMAWDERLSKALTPDAGFEQAPVEQSEADRIAQNEMVMNRLSRFSDSAAERLAGMAHYFSSGTKGFAGDK